MDACNVRLCSILFSAWFYSILFVSVQFGLVWLMFSVHVCLPHVATLHRFVNDDFMRFFFLLFAWEDCIFLWIQRRGNGKHRALYTEHFGSTVIGCNFCAVVYMLNQVAVEIGSRIVLGAFDYVVACKIDCKVDTGISQYDFNGSFHFIVFFVFYFCKQYC